MDKNTVLQKPKFRKTIAAIVIAVFAALPVSSALILSGCTSPGGKTPPAASPLSAGTYRISPSGGIIHVANEKTGLKGLTIKIPADAYEKEMVFAISSCDFTLPSSEKSADFLKPRSRLISIDNGGAAFNDPVEIKIPVSIPEDEFAMAFYYQKEAGYLEGLPVIAYGESDITVMTTHFSDIAVFSAPYSSLTAGSYDTGFLPGVDDFHFPNYGSFISQPGHCAGQSVAAMYYYIETRMNSKNAKPLFGTYDNNNRNKTPSLWYDDAIAVKLCSAIQKDMDFEARIALYQWKLSQISDYLTYCAFSYSMQVTGEPQLLCVYDPEHNLGHALIAYKIDCSSGSIYVADPNHPGQERRIRYTSDSGFLPYCSGDDPENAAPGDICFSNIVYYSKTSLVDWHLTGNRWAGAAAGDPAPDLFTDRLDIRYASSADPLEYGFFYSKLTDGMVTDPEKTAKPGEHYRGRLIIDIGWADTETDHIVVFRGTDIIGETGPGDEKLILPLIMGENDLGFYYCRDIMGKLYFYDFYRYRVYYSRNDSESDHETGPVGTLELIEATMNDDFSALTIYFDENRIFGSRPASDFTITFNARSGLSPENPVINDGFEISSGFVKIPVSSMPGLWGIYTVSIHEASENGRLLLQATGVGIVGTKVPESAKKIIIPRLISISPERNSTLDEEHNEIRLVFDSLVSPGSGSVYIYEHSGDYYRLFERIKASDAVKVSISDSEDPYGHCGVTLNLSEKLVPGREYYINIDENAFFSGQNYFPGIYSKAWRFGSIAPPALEE
ncbi:MAG: Ig-like domain-containing protein [Eubacteriales bacterium]|nr:Ig-like domain-containing protein [Eubacteriales bacterium]